MTSIVRNAHISTETWPLLDADALACAATPDDATGVLVPLALWLSRADQCPTLDRTFGVLLKNTDDPALLAADLGLIKVIAIEFPKFSDGRGYSIARLLRGRYGYRGELRAVGDVQLDQINYLTRVGFDAFALRDDQDPRACAAAGREFSEAYQASSDQPLPLFRRRAA